MIRCMAACCAAKGVLWARAASVLSLLRAGPSLLTLTRGTGTGGSKGVAAVGAGEMAVSGAAVGPRARSDNWD